MTNRIKITADVEQHVIDLYEQYKSSDKVAAEIGIGATTILRILERNGIKRTGTNRKSVDEQRIIELYKELRSLSAVARETKYSTDLIRRVLRDHDISIYNSKSNEVKSGCDTKYCPALIVMMLKLGYRPEDIVSYGVCGRGAIYKACKKRTGKTPKEVVGNGLKYRIPKALLVDMYVNERRSQREIASILNINRSSVIKLLKFNGIELDTHRRTESNRKERELLFIEQLDSASSGMLEYVSGYENAASKVTIRCKQCGKTFKRTAGEFEPGKPGRYRGCPECEYSKKKICDTCGNVFHSYRKNALYCCSDCKANRNRKTRQNRFKRLQSIEYCTHRTFVQNGSIKRRTDKYCLAYDSSIRLKDLIARDNNTCQICGKPCNANDHTYGLFGPMYPSIDHIVPLVKGGTHTWDNVQLAHIVCNSKKRDRVGGVVA